MSRTGGNVTVTIGAAFAGSFKSVLREADRELKAFGKKTTRTMKAADRAAGSLGLDPDPLLGIHGADRSKILLHSLNPFRRSDS